MDGQRFLNCATVNFYKRELALPNFFVRCFIFSQRKVQLK